MRVTLSVWEYGCYSKDEFHGGGELVGTMILALTFLYDDGSKTKGDREEMEQPPLYSSDFPALSSENS